MIEFVVRWGRRRAAVVLEWLDSDRGESFERLVSNGAKVRNPPLERATDDRVVFGVCGGIAHRFGINVLAVRLATATLLVITGGVGLIAYGALALLIPSGPGEVRPWTERSPLILVFLVPLAAVLYLLGLHVVTPPLGVLVPAALLTAGVALVWREMTTAREAGARPDTGEMVRVGAGLVLLVGGAVALLLDSGKVEELTSAFVAAAVVAAGLGLLVGPQLAEARAEADAERRRRILADERAEIASRLHDSVLQTLALIQREEDPRRAQALARGQERELRGWLYKGVDPNDDSSLGGALRAAADEVESNYGIEVDLVQTSDGRLDEGLAALAAAAREAMTNAGRHSNAGKVSVLARVAEGEASVFVRDSGRGFDPGRVEEDRHGVRESILGRMERSGGTARVVSSPGAGTEVELTLPRGGD